MHRIIYIMNVFTLTFFLTKICILNFLAIFSLNVFHKNVNIFWLLSRSEKSSVSYKAPGLCAERARRRTHSLMPINIL